jgi:prepilin-type N-terminal cleavage/methylation domain-containing protein
MPPPRTLRATQPAGFTLVELLVVLVVLAIVASVATFSVSAGDGRALESTAERLASTLESARWQAISTASRVALAVPQSPASASSSTSASASELSWYDQTREGLWLLRVTDTQAVPLSGATVTIAQPRPADGTPARLILGPEPVGPPACLLLTLDSSTIAIVSDGIAPFSLRHDARCG